VTLRLTDRSNAVYTYNKVIETKYGTSQLTANSNKQLVVVAVITTATAFGA
jgi:hypothetical protein